MPKCTKKVLYSACHYENIEIAPNATHNVGRTVLEQRYVHINKSVVDGERENATGGSSIAKGSGRVCDVSLPLSPSMTDTMQGERVTIKHDKTTITQEA